MSYNARRSDSPTRFAGPPVIRREPDAVSTRTDDLLFEESARKAGITGYFRPDALNSHPLFIDALAGLVLDTVDVPELVGAV